MKKFRFPLRPVAVLRAHRQSRAREAFAASVHAYVQAEEHLATVRARREELGTAMHDGRRGNFRAADEAAFWVAYRRVAEDEMASERAMIEAHAKMEQRRQDYMAAHRDVRIVEKLEQKARTAHRQEAERESQQELDEMGGYRVARRLAASTVISP